MNWIDIVILAILLIFIAFGFWKGFAFSVISLFGSFINTVISLFLTKPVNLLLNNWFKLEGSITNSLSHKISAMHEGFNTNLVGLTNKEIKSHISTTLSKSDFPLSKLFNRLIKIDSDSILDKTELTLNDILSKSLGSFFSLIISFIIIFILIYLFLFILTVVTKKIKEVESIRITDRILGVLFGAIKGAITIAFIIAIISLFKENGLLEPVINYIKQSTIGGFAYTHINTFTDKYITLQNVVKVLK